MRIGIGNTAYLRDDNDDAGLARMRAHGYTSMNYDMADTALPLYGDAPAALERRMRAFRERAESHGITVDQTHGPWRWPPQDATEEQRTEILKDIYRDIGRQIPSTWLEKWTAWRYLSMLFNLTTHIRNVVGNAGFAPIVMAKNKVSWLIESGVGLVNKDFEKTKAFLVGHGDLVKAADADFAKYQEVLFEGEKYRDTFNGNK